MYAGHAGRTDVVGPTEVASAHAKSDFTDCACHRLSQKASDIRADRINDDHDSNSKCAVVGYFVHDRKSLQTLFCAAQSLDT